MDLPVRKELPHTIPQWVAEGSWFFIIINCVLPGKNQLCRADTGDAVLTAVKFNHDRFVWHFRLCLLMPDHLHAIIAFQRESGMQTTGKNWKRFVAGKHGVDWQRDFFDHRLRDHHELEEKTSYLLINPVRKGLCERTKDWVWVYCPNAGRRRRLLEVGRAPMDRGTPLTARCNERRAPIRLRSRLRSTSAWRAGQAVTRPTNSPGAAPIRFLWLRHYLNASSCANWLAKADDLLSVPTRWATCNAIATEGRTTCFAFGTSRDSRIASRVPANVSK